MKTKWAIASLMVAVILLGAWNGLGQGQRSTRISYEYLVIDESANSLQAQEGLTKLNQLGAQGWELAGISTNKDSPTKLYLKRVKR